jgi:hypothetical protein
LAVTLFSLHRRSVPVLEDQEDLLGFIARSGGTPAACRRSFSSLSEGRDMRQSDEVASQCAERPGQRWARPSSTRAVAGAGLTS